jgi:hypothetical protein
MRRSPTIFRLCTEMATNCCGETYINLAILSSYIKAKAKILIYPKIIWVVYQMKTAHKSFQLLQEWALYLD